MRYYKLTDEKDQTHNNTQWGEGITNSAMGRGSRLCSADVIHVYDHPLKAAMFNPIHGVFSNPHLWQCRVKKIVANDRLKVGVKSCTTVKRVDLPIITPNQRVRFAILCALKMYHDPSFIQWVNDWLSGKRTTRANSAAVQALQARVQTETKIVPWKTARAAVSAAEWALPKTVAREAFNVAFEAAACAVNAAEEEKINFVQLIKKAIREEREND